MLDNEKKKLIEAEDVIIFQPPSPDQVLLVVQKIE